MIISIIKDHLSTWLWLLMLCSVRCFMFFFYQFPSVITTFFRAKFIYGIVYKMYKMSFGYWRICSGFSEPVVEAVRHNWQGRVPCWSEELRGRWAPVRLEDGSGPWYMWHAVGAVDGEGKRVSGTSQAYHPHPHPMYQALSDKAVSGITNQHLSSNENPAQHQDIKC